MRYVTYKGQRLTAADIRRAMQAFDAVRDRFPEWRWKTWGIRHDGAVYPPKELLRHATGFSVEGGGEQINALFDRLGFEVVQVGAVVPQNRPSAPDALDDLERCRPEYEGETDQDAIIKARLGQGRFRADVIDVWGCCAVTGCTEIVVLRASHIKPWRMSDNRERLDPFNGLLLIPNLDALFDAGLVSFSDTGKILLSARITGHDLSLLGVHAEMKLSKVPPRTRAYLAEHRRLHGF
jgi:hypothetical protein